MLKLASTLYGQTALARRDWYRRHPDRRRRLARPVVSVGNLSVGGTGKTPVVEHIARLLIARGERPAVLTRGYGRRLGEAGATVVADGSRVLADVDSAGDEPLMLARAVPGLTVIVGANRYLSGRLAERRLRATIHILDDGFQHFELARTVDLLLVSKDDVQDRPMPAGRLREPLDAASQADALIVDADDDDVTSIGAALGVRTIFRLARRSGSPRLVASAGPVAVPPGARVFAVAGIARPDRFFSRLASNGWQLVGTMAFRDHHRFGPRDIERIAASARSAEAAFVLTTDKDAVRLAACNLEDLGSLPVAAVPLVATIEPAAGFGGWLFERLQ